MDSLLQAFGVSAEDKRLSERVENIILRTGNTKYLKKSSSRFIDLDGNSQQIKLQIMSSGRVSKAFELFVPVDSELYKQAESLYAEAVAKYLTNVEATTVNQYRK